jgi:hypothetical protein
MNATAYRKTVIPSDASRRIFFRVRSCERVGLRGEESLFDASHRSRHTSSFSASLLSELHALCVNVFAKVFPATHYPLLTTHWSPA